MNLRNVSTSELVKELSSRTGVQAFESRPYCGYQIDMIKKFNNDRTPVKLPTNATVLVVSKCKEG